MEERYWRPGVTLIREEVDNKCISGTVKGDGRKEEKGERRREWGGGGLEEEEECRYYEGDDKEATEVPEELRLERLL